MAGMFNAREREVSYSFVARPNWDATYASPVLVQVATSEANVLPVLLDRAGSAAYSEVSPGQSPVDVLRAGESAVSPPLWYGPDGDRALNDFFSLIRDERLRSLLIDEDELVVPIFGSAPKGVVPLRKFIEKQAPFAAISVPGAAVGLAANASAPELVFFFAGGIVLLRIVDPVATVVGHGLAAAMRRRFNLEADRFEGDS